MWVKCEKGHSFLSVSAKVIHQSWSVVVIRLHRAFYLQRKMLFSIHVALLAASFLIGCRGLNLEAVCVLCLAPTRPCGDVGSLDHMLHKNCVKVLIPGKALRNDFAKELSTAEIISLMETLSHLG